MKRNGRATLIVIMLLLTTFGVDTSAGATGPDQRGYEIDTSAENNFRGSAPEAERIHRERLNAGPKGEELYRLAEKKRYVVGTSYSDSDPAQASTITHITFDECHANHQNPIDVPYWFRDKYNSCRNWGLIVTYLVVEGGQVREVGRTTFGITFIGLAQNGLNRIEHIRCDEATYVFGSKCVFSSVLSFVTMYAASPEHGQSASFILQAQTDVTKTKPGPPGKRVPGKLNETPLHRLYSGYDTTNKIPGSRRKIRRACRKHFTIDYAKNGLECDEYPFATTYENAALVDERGPWTYAVKAIDASHNGKAGSLYGAWLGNDHILDGDPFYVVIK